MNLLKKVTLVRLWQNPSRTVILNVKINLAPEILKEVFETAKGLYALRNENYPKTLNNINPLSFSSHS